MIYELDEACKKCAFGHILRPNVLQGLISSHCIFRYHSCHSVKLYACNAWRLIFIASIVLVQVQWLRTQGFK